MAQSIRGRVQNLPAEVDQAAVMQQLGSFSTVYKRRIFSSAIVMRILGVLFGVLLVIGGINILTFDFNYSDSTIQHDMGNQIIRAVFFVLFVAGGGSLSFFRLYDIFQSGRVYVFTHGLVRIKIRKVDAFRWDQVEALFVKIYKVKLANGKKLIFSQTLGNVKELGEKISSETARNLIPKAMETFREGAPLQFGKFVLNQQGIGIAKRILPWKSFRDIEIRNGRVIVRQEDLRRWASASLGSTPNVAVMQAVATRIAEAKISAKIGENKETQAPDSLLAPLAEPLIAMAPASSKKLLPGEFRIRVVESYYQAMQTVRLGKLLGTANKGMMELAVIASVRQDGSLVFLGEDGKGRNFDLNNVRKPAILLMARETLSDLQRNRKLWSRVKISEDLTL